MKTFFYKLRIRGCAVFSEVPKVFESTFLTLWISDTTFLIFAEFFWIAFILERKKKNHTHKKNPNKITTNKKNRNCYLVLFMYSVARISVLKVVEVALLSYCSAVLSKACPPSVPCYSTSDCMWQDNWLCWESCYVHAAI